MYTGGVLDLYLKCCYTLFLYWSSFMDKRAGISTDIDVTTEVISLAKEVLRSSECTENGPYLDVALSALILGVSIGAMDSVTTDKVMEFAKLYKKA
jgi:hypothetical protein